MIIKVGDNSCQYQYLMHSAELIIIFLNNLIQIDQSDKYVQFSRDFDRSEPHPSNFNTKTETLHQFKLRYLRVVYFFEKAGESTQ